MQKPKLESLTDYCRVHQLQFSYITTNAQGRMMQQALLLGLLAVDHQSLVTIGQVVADQRPRCPGAHFNKHWQAHAPPPLHRVHDPGLTE